MNIGHSQSKNCSLRYRLYARNKTKKRSSEKHIVKMSSIKNFPNCNSRN